jgi:bacterioferritin
VRLRSTDERGVDRADGAKSRESLSRFRGASLAQMRVKKKESSMKPNSGTPNPNDPQSNQFLSDIQEIRRRARQHIEQGAVTEQYRANRETVLKLLNEALATEIVCVLRYKRHYFMTQGLVTNSVAQEFLEHANEEQQHADLIAGRITQLNGEPDFNPKTLSDRSHAEYVEGKTLLEMLREDLVAERVAIESYTEMIRYIGNDDSTTRRMLEGILAVEEEHAEDLMNLLASHMPKPD